MDAYRCQIQFPVRFSDLDAMGHLNNASFLTYFEEGRAAWCRDCLGMPPESTAYPLIVAHIAIDYLLPVGFGREVEVSTRCSKVGQKSITIAGQIDLLHHDGPATAARYTAILAWYDYTTQATTAIPEEVRRQIRDYEYGALME